MQLVFIFVVEEDLTLKTEQWNDAFAAAACIFVRRKKESLRVLLLVIQELTLQSRGIENPIISEI